MPSYHDVERVRRLAGAADDLPARQGDLAAGFRKVSEHRRSLRAPFASREPLHGGKALEEREMEYR